MCVCGGVVEVGVISGLIIGIRKLWTVIRRWRHSNG